MDQVRALWVATQGIEPEPEVVAQALHAILSNGFCADTPASIADCAGKMGLGVIMAQQLVEHELGEDDPDVTKAMHKAAAVFRDIVDLQAKEAPRG